MKGMIAVKLKFKSLLAAATLACAGCTTVPLQVAPSSDPVEPGKYTVLGSEVRGSHTQVLLLGLISLGKSGSPIRSAIDDAIEQSPGADALVRVALETDNFSLPFVSFYKTYVTGTPVKINPN